MASILEGGEKFQLQFVKKSMYGLNSFRRAEKSTSQPYITDKPLLPTRMLASYAIKNQAEYPVYFS